jgi:hypothetical protein
MQLPLLLLMTMTMMAATNHACAKQQTEPGA